MDSILKILILTVLVLSIYSCDKGEEITQDQLIQEYIDEKMSESRLKFEKECADNTIKDAEEYVDSIIVQQVNFLISDTLRTPSKPIKPPRPFDTLSLEDTLVTPILNDSLLQLKDTIIQEL